MLNNPVPSPKLNILSPAPQGMIELPIIEPTEPKKSRFNTILSPISTPYQTPIQTPVATPSATPLPGTQEYEELDYIPTEAVRIPGVETRTMKLDKVKGTCSDKYRLEKVISRTEDDIVQLQLIGHFRTLKDIELKLGLSSKTVTDILRRRTNRADDYVITKLYYVGDQIPLKAVYDKFEPDKKVNYVEMFIKDYCLVNKDYREVTSDLLIKYNEWAKKKGAPDLNARTLKAELKSNGFEYRKGEARMEVRGLKLKPEHSKLIL